MWEDFGPLAFVFWIAWAGFGLLAASGLILMEWNPFIQGLVGFAVTTVIYQIANAVEGHL